MPKSIPLSYRAVCASGACVQLIEDTERGGFVFTSTIADNNGSVFYTYDEFRQFVDDVQAGAVAHVYDKATRMGTENRAPLEVVA